MSGALPSAHIRVLLCDDHRLFREGATRILADEDDIVVVAETSSVEKGLRAAEALKPAVIILDIAFPHGPSGLEGISGFLNASPGTHILMVSMHHDRSFARAAIDAGANGYVTKDCAGDELISAVRVVALGGQYMPHAIDQPVEKGGLRLTVRESQVLSLLGNGHTSAEIADRLYLSVRTVETYRAHLLRKFGATTRAELIRAAKERGVL